MRAAGQLIKETKKEHAGRTLLSGLNLAHNLLHQSPAMLPVYSQKTFLNLASQLPLPLPTLLKLREAMRESAVRMTQPIGL